MAEYHHQVTVVDWFKITYPQYANNIIAIMNERQLRGNAGQRAGQVKKMKRAGYKSGVSDLFIAVPAGHWHGLWLEMKDEGKTIKDVTESQMSHLMDMSSVRYCVNWAPGADRAIEIIKQYMDLLND